MQDMNDQWYELRHQVQYDTTIPYAKHYIFYGVGLLDSG